MNISHSKKKGMPLFGHPNCVILPTCMLCLSNRVVRTGYSISNTTIFRQIVVSRRHKYEDRLNVAGKKLHRFLRLCANFNGISTRNHSGRTIKL